MKKLTVAALSLILVSSIGFGMFAAALPVNATEEIATVSTAPSLLLEEETTPTIPIPTASEDSVSDTEIPDTTPTEPEPNNEESSSYQPQEIETNSGSEDSYTNVNETVYTTTAVNVRTGPSTDAEKIGMLNPGAEISRTGIGSNGWSKVSFEGQEAYMRSDYLVTSEVKNTSPIASHAATVNPETSTGDETVTFEDVNETVYATTGVNVRTGPDTAYEKLGMCSRGNSVTRTGVGSNGWSRVTYNGSTAYIHSDYLSTTKPAAVWKDGMYGRLTIPSIGVDVGLYYCSDDAGSRAQKIVDAVDSAAYMDQGDAVGAIIADHKHQGFSAIKKAVPYETYAYIDYGSHTQTYVCTAVGLGHNYGNDLVDWNGVSLNYDHIPGGLAMYTCNENWNNVTITYWQPV